MTQATTEEIIKALVKLEEKAMIYYQKGKFVMETARKLREKVEKGIVPPESVCLDILRLYVILSEVCR